MAPSYFQGTSVCNTTFSSVLLSFETCIIGALVAEISILTACCAANLHMIICYEPLRASGAHTKVSGDHVIISHGHMIFIFFF